MNPEGRLMEEERKQRRVRLTPDQKWQIFLEASRKNTTDAEVCRKWGITVWQLKAIRERVKDGSLQALKRGPGRSKTDPQIAELRHELERSNEALKELAIENTLLRGKVNGV
jgi:transposase-like protein